MSKVNRIVDVQISRETTQINTASFSIPLILVTAAVDADVTDRVLTFTDLDSVGEEFGTSSSAYIIAGKLFGQTLKPTEIKVGIRLSTETLVAALATIRGVDDTWYALVSESHTAADVLALAAYIQANYKIYGTSTNDVVTPTSGTTDIGSQLEALGYDRTFVVYSATANADYPEAAWIGSQLAEVPGSNTWAFKQGAGVTQGNLSSGQITFLEGKNVNYFTDIGGVNIFMTGAMANGTWIDEMVFVDWLRARIQEGIFFRLINKKKIPFTKKGFAIIENEIRSVLTLGVTNGGIADDTPFTVVVPNPLDIPETQRAQRIAGNFTFTARLAGAVHKVIVRGTVTV